MYTHTHTLTLTYRVEVTTEPLTWGNFVPAPNLGKGVLYLLILLRTTGDINCRCKDTERNYHRQLPFWKVLGARHKLREMEQHPLRTFAKTKERRLGCGTDQFGSQ